MAKKTVKRMRIPNPIEVQPAPENAATPEKRVSKAKAVRAAIDAGKTSPEEGIPFVKRRFGIVVSKPHFFTIKSVYKRAQSSTDDSSGPKPKADRPRLTNSKAPMSGEPDVLAALEAMKPLVAALGAEKVKRIADLLG